MRQSRAARPPPPAPTRSAAGTRSIASAAKGAENGPLPALPPQRAAVVAVAVAAWPPAHGGWGGGAISIEMRKVEEGRGPAKELNFTHSLLLPARACAEAILYLIDPKSHGRTCETCETCET
jgi:hypothetical protein